MATLFKFEDLAAGQRAVQTVQRQLKKAGAEAVQVEIGKIKRMAGETFRELFLTFADSQQVTLCIKRTGDVFRVKLNKKDLPIKAQDDQAKAMSEIVSAMDKGRAAFQKKLTRARVEVPKGMKSSAPNRMKALTDKRDALKEVIADLDKQIEEQNKRNEELRAQIAAAG